MCLWTMRCLRVSTRTLRKGSHLEKLTFLRRLTLTWLWTLRLLRVSKHTIRQDYTLRNSHYSGTPWENSYPWYMAVDLQISYDQGIKTRFESKLGKSCTLSLPVDLEKTLSDCAKIRENLETPWKNPNASRPWDKNKSPLSRESDLKKNYTLRKCWPTLRFCLNFLKFLSVWSGGCIRQRRKMYTSWI